LKINKITCAVIAALAVARAAHAAEDAAATPTPDASSLGTVTVTAQRSSENMQDVPITIQAFTGDTLQKLSVSTMDDIVRYLPNVQFATNGPGQGNIYIRGLAAGFAGSQSTATIAPFPNVAAYLDDQAMTFPARNLDIYLADIERVEVLEGPQGTLFGGGAEAGAIRYITNKPRLDKVSGSVNASYGVTASGDPNNALNAVLNLPLTDSFALRGVIYNDHRGGYIDNVPSTFTRSNNDNGTFQTGIKPGANGLCPNGLPTVTGYCATLNSQVGNNLAVARKNWNPTDYGGARLSALYKINDGWDVLIAQSYQNMDSEGQASTYPIGSEGQPLKPLQITAFSPAWDKDRFSNTSWTVNGKVGDLTAVYTGGYTDRHIDQQQDYSNYTRSTSGWYYSCVGGAGFNSGSTPLTCFSPVTSWRDQVKNTHWSHEFRMSTPEDWRLRGIAGVYYENFHIFDNMNFNYKTIPSCTPENLASALAGGLPCVANVQPAPGSTIWQPGVRSDSTAFGEDAQRGYKQVAVFGSGSYDIIPDVLTATLGTRYYRYSEFQVGSQYATDSSCMNVPNGQCSGGMVNMDAEHLHATYHGFKSRANLVWHIDTDQMLYYTFSQGFRPGAFNRTVSGVAKGPDGKPQFEKPHGYAPDSLTNNEIGYKAEFLDHHLLLDASLYHMHWNKVQTLFFNPLYLGNTTFGVNGPDYKVDGLELQGTWRLTDAFSLQGAGSWNHPSQLNSPCLVGNISGTAAYGQCITQVLVKGVGVIAVQNLFGAPGTVPAFAPKAEFNLRARYDFEFNGYKAYAMVGGNHISSMYNQPATYQSGDTYQQAYGVAFPPTVNLRYLQPGYTTYDASINIARDNWNAMVYGSNLSNSHASVFTSSAQFIKSEVPIRPRIIGVNFGYKF